MSGGNTFSCDIDEIYDDFAAADLIIGHNVKFDIDFMIAEFLYQSRRFRYKESFDTMRFFTPIMKLPRTSNKGYKYPKLTELSEFLDIYPYDVTRKTGEIFGSNAVGSHDARYDTAELYLCFIKGLKTYPEIARIVEEAERKED